MAYNEITKFQLLAGLIREDRAYRELEGAETFGDILIEILRRLHHWNDNKWDATDVIDFIFEAIAEEFRYAIGEWDATGSDTDSNNAEPTQADVLAAIERTIIVAREDPTITKWAGQATNPTPPDESIPPQLDIPDQH